jgi:hypothetical protein
MTPYCSDCHRECEVSRQEIGIGSHDFMGSVYRDKRYGLFSVCCDAPVINEDGNEWEE